jgi:hypothetical protein
MITRLYSQSELQAENKKLRIALTEIIIRLSALDTTKQHWVPLSHERLSSADASIRMIASNALGWKPIMKVDEV